MSNKKPDRYISALPIPGERLPSDWRQMAPKRAAMADADYRYRLENAWRGNQQNINIMQAAQLSRQSDIMPTHQPYPTSNHAPLSWDELTGSK